MRVRETSLLNHGCTHMQNSDTHRHTNLVHKTEKCVANLLILPVYNATSFVDQNCTYIHFMLRLSCVICILVVRGRRLAGHVSCLSTKERRSWWVKVCAVWAGVWHWWWQGLVVPALENYVCVIVTNRQKVVVWDATQARNWSPVPHWL